MPDIPTNEPAELRLGDTWQWRREDLADYPASEWTLTYRFKNAAGGFEIVATADGDAFAVSVAATTTAAYAGGAGDYTWAAQVSKAGEKHTVDSGVLTVLPNLFSGTTSAASDQRTHAQKVLSEIEALIEGRASKDQQEYTIAGRSLKRMALDELLMLRDRYRNEVAAEQGRRYRRVVAKC